MFGGIFKLVRSVVNGVISQVMQQAKVVEEVVTSPLRAVINQVVGGMWTGKGADAFVEEMSELVIPALIGIMGSSNRYADAIKKSMEHMDQAENKANGIAQELFGVFQGIFK